MAQANLKREGLPLPSNLHGLGRNSPFLCTMSQGTYKQNRQSIDCLLPSIAHCSL